MTHPFLTSLFAIQLLLSFGVKAQLVTPQAQVHRVSGTEDSTLGDLALYPISAAYLQKDYSKVLNLTSDAYDYPQALAMRGMAAQHLGDDAKAALAYELLLSLRPFQSESRENLKRINEKHGALVFAHRPPALVAWIPRYAMHVFVFVGLVLVGSIIVTGYLFSVKSPKKWLWVSLSVFLLLTCLLLNGIPGPKIADTDYRIWNRHDRWLRAGVAHRQEWVMVTQPQAVVRFHHDAKAPKLMELPLTSVVRFLRKHEDYTYIEIHPEGDSPKRGWVLSSNLSPLYSL